ALPPARSRATSTPSSTSSTPRGARRPSPALARTNSSERASAAHQTISQPIQLSTLGWMTLHPAPRYAGRRVGASCLGSCVRIVCADCALRILVPRRRDDMSRTWLKPLSVGLFVVIGLLLAVVPAAAQTPLGA